ncbi:endonuclease domain-containing protein [Mycobacterium sp.]|uniref:endonuclease domain-containing protein n=1 Tax=Mycobacterium sp. TaxID=1785 RepID=UPI003D6B0351
MKEPFIGSEALACGALSRHQLRSRHRAVFPNVYLATELRPSLERRIAAAWLWSDRRAIIAGTAAAALHGAKWIGDDIPIELIYPNTRPPRGVLTRRDVLIDDEMMTMAGLAVTTPGRTAYDIGRRAPRRTAVAQLDALARATGLKVDDVAALAQHHRGARQLRKLETVLQLVDPGAESPQETYLRLLLVEAGLPRPQTQIPVLTGEETYYLDMGWEDCMVAVEYDGDHHRVEPWQWRKDIRRREKLERMGWVVIRVIAGDDRADILRRVRCALAARKSSVH